MVARLCLLLALAGFARAAFPVAYGAHGYAPQVVSPAITSQHSNILRSYGNLGQVSTYSKSIDTPFSSVRKSDVRVSNPGYATYAAPAYAHGYAAPAYAAHGYAAPAYAAHGYAAPAYAAHGYAAPAYAHGVVAPAYGPKAVVASPGLLGVAYSAAPAVAHMSYSNALGFNYAW